MQRPFKGGFNGGGMMRTVQRVIRAGVGGASPEPISAADSSASDDSRKPHNLITTFPSLSASVRERFPSVINDAPPHCDSNYNIGNDDWEYIQFYGNNHNYSNEFAGEDYYRMFGTVPSTDEVVNAVSALHQQMWDDISSSSSSSPKRNHEAIAPTEGTSSNEYTEIQDWIEPSLDLCASRERVYDAFHLLQNDPSVQRMVVSLSSDKSVWAAVLENEVVKELRNSITQQADVASEEESSHGGSTDGDGSSPIKNFFGSFINDAKARIMQLIDKITKLVNEILQAPPIGEEKERDKNNDRIPFEDKVKASFMLSIAVLLIVIVARARGA